MTPGSLRGAVVWAVVPYVPEAPFWIYRVDDRPLEVKSAGPLFESAQKAESEFRFLVRAKARPVLVLADTPDPRVDEYLTLRLVRLGVLSDEARERVVAGRDALLLPVRKERAPRLAEEFAVMIGAPVRVHASALDVENVLGRLDADELRVVHERFAKLHRLDLLGLVREEIDRIRALQERRRSSGR